jgi:hypothetical protein
MLCLNTIAIDYSMAIKFKFEITDFLMNKYDSKYSFYKCLSEEIMLILRQPLFNEGFPKLGGYFL